MADIAALIVELETNPVYDIDVAEGHNGSLVRRLNTSDVSIPKRWRSISSVAFMDAIAGEILTVRQEERVRTYTAEDRDVPIHKAGVRQWMQDNFSVETMAALQVLSQRDGTLADVFLGDEEERMTLADVRDTVRQIGKSHIRKYYGREVFRV